MDRVRVELSLQILFNFPSCPSYLYILQNVYAVIDVHGQVEAVSTTSTMCISVMQSSICAVIPETDLARDAVSSQQDADADDASVPLEAEIAKGVRYDMMGVQLGSVLMLIDVKLAA